MADAEFICTGCGDNVFWFGEHDGEPLCSICRYIRAHPNMPEDIKAALRGDDDEQRGNER